MYRYNVVIEDYYRKNIGRIVARATTIVEARKVAYAEIGKTDDKTVSVYKQKVGTSGPMELIGEVQKWYSGKRFWYTEDGAKYPLNKDGSIGKRLR